MLDVLERIERKINLLNSPRLTQREARRYLRIGDSKFRALLSMGKIKRFIDEFGQGYFLRQNLDNYLNK